MNLIERVDWLDEAKRTPQRRLRNWLLHILFITAIITITFLTIMPPEEDVHFVFAIIGGFIVALNIVGLESIIPNLTRKKHDKHLSRW